MEALVSACLLAGLELAGQTTCPAAPAVVAALARIDPAIARHEAIAIEPAPRGGAVIRFRSPAGALLAERPLPPALSCAERAEAAAVIIAARLQEAPPPPAPLPRPLVAAAPAPPPRAMEIEAAAVVTRAGASFAPGVRAGVALGTDRIARLALGYVAAHETPIGAGQVTWSRAALTLAYAQRWRPLPWPAVFGEAALGAVASLTNVAGTGLSTVERARVFHPGLAAELRAGGDRGLLRASVGLGFDLWLRSQGFYLRNGPTAAGPRWQLVAALTLGWRGAGR